MLRLGLLVVLVLSLQVFGCTSSAYKTAVETYAANVAKNSRAIRDSCQRPSPSEPFSEECMLAAMAMSGIQCLVDEDTKKSTAEARSRACKCSRPTDAADRTAACTDWLNNG